MCRPVTQVVTRCVERRVEVPYDVPQPYEEIVTVPQECVRTVEVPVAVDQVVEQVSSHHPPDKRANIKVSDCFRMSLRILFRAGDPFCTIVTPVSKEGTKQQQQAPTIWSSLSQNGASFRPEFIWHTPTHV